MKWTQEEFNNEVLSLIKISSFKDWKVCNGYEDEQCIYLCRDSYITPFQDNKNRSCRQEEDMDDGFFDDENAWNESPDNDIAVLGGEDCVEWVMSIVYNHTYCVPVVYFRVHHLDGRSLSYEEVLQNINLLKSNFGSSEIGRSMSSEIISEEEHPVTGLPHYFLHPCKTDECLDLLHSCNDDVINGLRLLSWMSMVLNNLHHISLSSHAYTDIRNKLLRT